MRRPTPFFAGALSAALPIGVWAAHFVACYVGIAVGCNLGWHEGVVAGLSPLRWGLAAASALALALAALLLWRSYRPGGGGPGLQGRVRRLVGWLALIAIAWTTVPLFALPTCHFT